MGNYWQSIWRRLAVETGRVDWENFRANQELMRHIENPTTGRVLAVAQRCRDEFRVPVDLMRDSLVGGPRGAVKFAGVSVTRASVEHARMAWAVREKLYDRPLSQFVVEIGGGFGGLAWSICRSTSVANYTFVDHPAVLRVQRMFVQGISEELEATGSMPRLGFRFVRSDEYEKNDWYPSVDVVINTRSMMEMDHAEINRYFGWIASALSPGGIFYSVNRLDKVTRLDDWPWGLFEILERRRWPEYLDRGPMDEIVARRRIEMSTDPIGARCRRCRKEVEFPNPDSKAVSEMKWRELVLTRKDEDAEYCRLLWRTQPRRVVSEFFACSCGGPLQVIDK